MFVVKTVTISTTTIGASFGTRGVIRDARTGRAVKADLPIRPYGFTIAAERDAAVEVDRRGWVIA